MFKHFFGFDQKDTPELLSAIEHAIDGVEPMLKETHRYPEAYRKPVKTALEYAHSLAFSLPGPVAVNLDSYARDAFVHAIFPSMDFVYEAFRASRSIQEYLNKNSSIEEVYALMGMRRFEKSTIGMELSGQVIQREVAQNVVYFTSHTIVDPAPSEKLARERVALGFFNNLVSKVANLTLFRKQEIQSKVQEMDLLKARLHAATAENRPALEKELSNLLANLQNATRSLDLDHYVDDFEAIFLNPEQHLHLNQTPMILDGLGIRRNSEGSIQGTQIIFNDLIGFDRRDWTVTMVHCHNLQNETFASKLETAYRRLSI